MNFIGEKIRSIRTLKGFSQENMADMLDISLPTYADIERGKKDVTINRLEQIAEKLGVTLNDVLAFNERVANFLTIVLIRAFQQER
jgi:transcriptional regulator with XRE-family HTH domain